MKNIVVLLSLLLGAQVFAQRKPKIKGNKSVVEVEESLPAFNAIQLNDDLDITLQKANREGYSLTADDNLIDVLKFKVEDSTLVITSFYKITSKKKLDITIKYYELSSVTIRDGRIRMTDAIETDELTINTYGSSKLQLNANTTLTTLTMEGNSSGDLSLNSDSLNIALKDRADVDILSTSQRNNIQMIANSGAKMEGTTYALSAILSDNANLKARKLEAEGVEVIAEGSPNARIYASDIFELTAKGSSKIYLSGNPKIDILEFLDTAELHKEK
ncbi:GIN domain-containing protein [Maribacter sp. 2308TA10-17]|uniref:GIN domain-containing protein n=1 Tax=Maribacter sp. 2308TA10-17 TaxID=3386276 RepID=UPI0039BD6D21